MLPKAGLTSLKLCNLDLHCSIPVDKLFTYSYWISLQRHLHPDFLNKKWMNQLFGSHVEEHPLSIHCNISQSLLAHASREVWFPKKVWEENTINFQDLHSPDDTDTTAAPHQRYEDSNQHWESAARMKRNIYKSLLLKHIHMHSNIKK